jgi:hypothetical protein
MDRAQDLERLLDRRPLLTSDASCGPGWFFSSRGPAFQVDGTTAGSF